MTTPNIPAASTAKSWRDTIKVHPAADLFPMMNDEELDALGEDIKQCGLNHKVIFFGPRPADIDKVNLAKNYKLIDGRNRLDAMQRAGIDLDLFKHTNILIEGESDPYAYVVSANIHRRHLTAEDKRDLIAKLLKANPEKSDRQVAEITKVSHPTVAKVRKEAEAAGDVEKVSTRTDTKGRQQRGRPSLRYATKRGLRSQRP
jgi:hypothetical protein